MRTTLIRAMREILDFYFQFIPLAPTATSFPWPLRQPAMLQVRMPEDVPLRSLWKEAQAAQVQAAPALRGTPAAPTALTAPAEFTEPTVLASPVAPVPLTVPSVPAMHSGGVVMALETRDMNSPERRALAEEVAQTVKGRIEALCQGMLPKLVGQVVASSNAVQRLREEPRQKSRPQHCMKQLEEQQSRLDSLLEEMQATSLRQPPILGTPPSKHSQHSQQPSHPASQSGTPAEARMGGAGEKKMETTIRFRV